MPTVSTLAVITMPEAPEQKVEVCETDDGKVVLHVKGEGGDTATIYMSRAVALTLVQHLVEAVRD